MNLFDRYIDEVGKHLPAKTRGDIQAEIRSTLEDMLEDRATGSGRAADDNLRKEVLAEYGAPDKVAASYLPEKYLIGPKLYPMFSLVLKIVFSVLTVLAMVGFGVRFGQGPLSGAAFGVAFGRSLLEYLGGMISAFGNIVVVFAILQWALPDTRMDPQDEGKKWDPASLEKEPDPDLVGMAGEIWAIVFTIAALLVFNFYPQIIGFGYLENGSWTFVPALSKAFFQYLPWIDLLWVLQIVLHIILLRQGVWTTATRWFKIALNLGGIALAALLLSGPALLALDPQTIARALPQAGTAETLVKLFSMPVTIALVVVIVVDGIETARGMYRLLFKTQTTPTLARR